jgi:hypothetical protein
MYRDHREDLLIHREKQLVSLKNLDYHIVSRNDRELHGDKNGLTGGVSNNNYLFAPEGRTDFVRDSIHIDKDIAIHIQRDLIPDRRSLNREWEDN